jgi:hypothetical protein
VDLPGLAVYSPPPEYALAMKLASLPAAPPTGALDDLRFLLRALNLNAVREAIDVVTRYVADRHLPRHAQTTLRQLLS